MTIPIVGFRALVHPADIVKSITYQDLAGTNVVLINMPLRETARPNTTPEGPLLLATNLQQNYGVNATLIDLNAYRIKDELAERRGLKWGRHLTHEEVLALIQRHISKHGEPAMVGFSGKITTLDWQEKVAKITRQLAPDTFLVSGNGLATDLETGLFNPEWIP